MLNIGQYLTDGAKVTRISNAVAAGTSDIECSSVDMTGYDGVVFIALIGTLTATQVTSLNAEQSANDSTFNEISGSDTGNMADGDSNKVLVCDVFRPTDRYVRAVVERHTANAVVDGVLAIQYHAREQAVTQSSSVAKSSQVGPEAPEV